MKFPRVSNVLLAPLLASLLPTASGCIDDDPLDESAAEVSEGSYEILGGRAEQDYYHPWRAVLSGTNCNGVLIHPEWVLTAAHCADASTSIRLGSTDRLTGVGHYHYAQRMYAVGNYGVYTHPQYRVDGGFGTPKNDIALIRIKPQTLDRYVQTAALPDIPLSLGTRGQLVSKKSQSGNISAGYVKSQTMTVDSSCAPFSGAQCVSAPAVSLCSGDSGSGFYRRLGGSNGYRSWGGPERTTVVGIASYTTDRNCDSPGSPAGISDVYYYKSWILNTIASSHGGVTPPANQAELEGNVVLRQVGAGAASPGQLFISCTDTVGRAVSATAPMDVRGVSLGLQCNPNAGPVRVRCGTASGSLGGVKISRFTYEMNGRTYDHPYGANYAGAEFRGTLHGRIQFTCTTSVKPLVATRFMLSR